MFNGAITYGQIFGIIIVLGLFSVSTISAVLIFSALVVKNRRSK